MSTLRTSLIRLAHTRPNLRPHLLPLLHKRQAALFGQFPPEVGSAHVDAVNGIITRFVKETAEKLIRDSYEVESIEFSDEVSESFVDEESGEEGTFTYSQTASGMFTAEVDASPVDQQIRRYLSECGLASSFKMEDVIELFEEAFKASPILKKFEFSVENTSDIQDEATDAADTDPPTPYLVSVQEDWEASLSDIEVWGDEKRLGLHFNATGSCAGSVSG